MAMRSCCSMGGTGSGARRSRCSSVAAAA
jgi:hypothetical protein